MKKLLTQTAMAVALAVPAVSFAATTTITFDTNGAAVGGVQTVDTLDWKPGNALSVLGNPSTGLYTGAQTQLLYQTNLGTALLNGSTVATAGSGDAQYFTLVAGVNEAVTGFSAVGSGAVVTFGLADSANSPTNFFKIYANQVGDDLAGTGFANPLGTVVASGYIAAINTSSYFTLGATSAALDSFGTNNWVGTGSLIGSGATDMVAKVTFADVNYFPDLMQVGAVTLALTNTSIVTPFNQVNPSRAFSSDGILDGDHVTNVGSVNGVQVPGAGGDFDFIFQADGNTAFQIPEPGSLALLGLGLGFLGFVARRKTGQA